jgi:hypothetical protein
MKTKFVLKIFSIVLLLFISFTLLPDVKLSNEVNKHNLINKYEDMLMYKNQSGVLEQIDNQYYVHIDSGIDSEYLPVTLSDEQIQFITDNVSSSSSITCKIISINKDKSDIGSSSSCFVELTLCKRNYMDYEILLFIFIVISVIWFAIQ